MKNITFFDLEIEQNTKKILDVGAFNKSKGTLHTSMPIKLEEFVSDSEYVCGHNIIHHDLEYLQYILPSIKEKKAIDTLYLSPLMFPQKPYHKLLKNDKLQVDELNNPVNDSIKARDLFYDEVDAFNLLSENLKKIYFGLLYNIDEFRDFFDYLNYYVSDFNRGNLIKEEFKGKICENANIGGLIREYPIELAYALSLIGCGDKKSVTPPWVVMNYPRIDNVITLLCNTPCPEGCEYCNNALNIHTNLKKFFGYDAFRTYEGEPLQENAVRAAVEEKSLLAVFPTGGGKSLTFQLPALIAGEACRGLTVVISPLQSLMKDQVDNLVQRGIDNAVAINGLLSTVEKKNAIERVMSGSANILYISPEQLRSKTIEKMLRSRNIVRFVIDEAHCFSAWGQDFRVDYLYIAKFIDKLQQMKQINKKTIPVSCFTATAKPKVISDILQHFKDRLNLNLELFASSSTRKNLHYTVLFEETENDKYNMLRMLLEQKKCPAIVYVSRTKECENLASKLTTDGFHALPYHGQMDTDIKIKNQEAFMNDEVRIIVATSAFGMGVDKSNVGLVVHYNISDSLENYVQEAGRAGRDPKIEADCYVLFNNQDLDNHLMLLNQSKLSFSEIQQVWQAIKELTRQHPNICCSSLEIARYAGWDTSVNTVESRVRTAISALETAGYVERGNNMPRIYATSIKVKNMSEASERIQSSPLFDEEQIVIAKRIIQSLISSRSIANAGNSDSESRVDYLADVLGIEKEKIIYSINLMKQEGILENYNDMTAFVYDGDSEKKSKTLLDRFIKLEAFILEKLFEDENSFSFKELNEEIIESGITKSNIKDIRTILHFLTIRNYISKEEDKTKVKIILSPKINRDKFNLLYKKRIDICKFILDYLFTKPIERKDNGKGETKVVFSLVGILNEYNQLPRFDNEFVKATQDDIEEALLYLNKINAMKLEGGFLVLYNGMEIKRLVLDNRIKYKQEDYRLLDEFYKQKIQQIHIVGEYANLMVSNYSKALEYVHDYFSIDFEDFKNKYFKGEKRNELNLNVTSEKYSKLFSDLSEDQRCIIDDKESKFIVVAAGPGSGKTRILVHKLASLLLMEDVKSDQLLMLTFSRAAAIEFKKRLIDLIGLTAHFVDIKTFHSYCFDLIGRIGTIEKSENVVREATEMILANEVEQGKITKTVLVIDEAQDMDEDSFALVKALMYANDDMRVIAVGDDDQNIYEFRNSNSKYMKEFLKFYSAKKYELLENYRSAPNLIDFSNEFVSTIIERMKYKPIEAIKTKNGKLKIVKHIYPNMEYAIINDLIESNNDGITCVMTNTNEEALALYSILKNYGKRAKLIQTLNDINLSKLFEVREFLKYIKTDDNSPLINKDLWNQAKKKFEENFKDSPCFDNILTMISDFEDTREKMYYSDLDDFIYESNYEDFYPEPQKEIIYVSTIHKTKGREFDNVFIMLKNQTFLSDEEKRKIYVGITRAKSNLTIHLNTEIFKNYTVGNLDYLIDDCTYDEPKQIILQASYRDIYLGSFKNKDWIMKKLALGQEIYYKNDCICSLHKDKDFGIGYFSTAFKKTLEKQYQKGYSIDELKVRFTVYWKDEADENETLIILPDIYMSKKDNQKDNNQQ